MNILQTYVCMSLFFKAKTNQLLVNLKNVDQRKKSSLVDHSGTMPTDWKQRNYFSELGETWDLLRYTQKAILILPDVCLCVRLPT